MHGIIDAALDVGAYAERLAGAGVRTVVRYYNNKNSQVHPTKCLTLGELRRLEEAGLSAAVVFQQRGGAGGRLEDLTAQTGARDGARALVLAQQLGQPKGTAIYFAVDHDFYRPSELRQITAYFEAARQALGGLYIVGSYGSGTIGTHLRDAGLVQHIWLAGSMGWSGTAQVLRDGDWSLFQKDLELRSSIGGFIYDGNIANPAHENFGQFRRDPGALSHPRWSAAALYQVSARSGLNLRSGPSETYRVIQTTPYGSIVKAMGRQGDWLAIDLEGDGGVDGFMFEGFLDPVSGGLPLSLSAVRKPIDVARAELALNIKELPGDRQNPRIVMYHATTRGGAAPDETAWCSSFVNYCVEQAGLVGTDSKWARSWHDAGWGRDVTESAKEGDLVVWRRQGNGDDGGHVGFFIDADEAEIRVLGGNQSNSLCIAAYPRAGAKGLYRYDLLSIRR